MEIAVGLRNEEKVENVFTHIELAMRETRCR
jgi:hypothetical protein